MPRPFVAYEPDQIDCNTITTALGVDFSVIPEITVSFARDKVITTCRCYRIAGDRDDGPSVVSKHEVGIKGTKSHWVAIYSVMIDCWHQLDRGVLGVAQTPVTRSWNGRPATPRRRNAN